MACRRRPILVDESVADTRRRSPRRAAVGSAAGVDAVVSRRVPEHRVPGVGEAAWFDAKRDRERGTDTSVPRDRQVVLGHRDRARRVDREALPGAGERFGA